jgi:hypothetical protein
MAMVRFVQNEMCLFALCVVCSSLTCLLCVYYLVCVLDVVCLVVLFVAGFVAC